MYFYEHDVPTGIPGKYVRVSEPTSRFAPSGVAPRAGETYVPPEEPAELVAFRRLRDRQASGIEGKVRRLGLGVQRGLQQLARRGQAA